MAWNDIACPAQGMTRFHYLFSFLLACTSRVSIAAGPDLITTEVEFCEQLGRLGPVGGGMIGMACGTQVCNVGDEHLRWTVLPSTNHPVISLNLFRMRTVNGSARLEQIGQSWVKHTFAPGLGDGCGNICQDTPEFDLFGAGCRDPYVAAQFVHCDLGPRSAINAYTGAMPGGPDQPGGGGCLPNFPANNHAGHIHDAVSHRLQVKDSDLAQAGARYFVEGQYVSFSEFDLGNGNQNDNVSYREIRVQGPSPVGLFTFSHLGSTLNTRPAIRAWSGSSFSVIEPAPLVDGQAILGFKVTNLAPNLWHYEYAIQNVNLDRSIGSFSVPVPSGVTLKYAEFNAPRHHAPELHAANYDNTAWTLARNSSSISWATEGFSANPQANAIRWGSMYNFRFDANSPPQMASVTIGMFKTGEPWTVTAMVPSQLTNQNCNDNGLDDMCDVTCAGICNLPGCGLSADCNDDGVPDECQGDCDGNGIWDPCQNDCDSNLVSDACEILANAGLDCNSDSSLDECDLAGGSSLDCNNNFVPDECEPAIDCNSNGVQDVCDIASGFSEDFDRNGIPDECDSPGFLTIHVDDDGANDPGPGNSSTSDPLEDGSLDHPFDSIQDAIQISYSGDTVLVHAGTYTHAGNHEIDYGGRGITVRCDGAPGDCVIDLEQTYVRAFDFHNGEGRNAVLDSMMVMNGKVELVMQPEAPIEIRDSSNPTLRNCIFSYSVNEILSWPLAHCASNSAPLFEDCQFIGGNANLLIDGNSAVSLDRCSFYQAGIVIDGGSATIRQLTSQHAYPPTTLDNTVVRGAIAISQDGHLELDSSLILDCNGDGVVVDATSSAAIRNVIVNQCAGIGLLTVGGPMSVRNSIVHGNQTGMRQRSLGTINIANSIIRANTLHQVFYEQSSNMQMTYSNVEGGFTGTGNIDADPLVVNAALGDFHLQPGSPCIDAGNSRSGGLPIVDFDGGMRIADDPTVADSGLGGPPIIDMGAHEFQDCNGNFVDDALDIAQLLALDCNDNGSPDDCDIAGGTAIDCEPNGIPDVCDIAGGAASDCQQNGIPDGCDINSGVSLDKELDGVPDECLLVTAALEEPSAAAKNRYLSFAIDQAGAGLETAIRVEQLNLMNPVPANLAQFPPYDFSALEGEWRYVGVPGNCVETEQPATSFKCATLQCAPVYLDWRAAIGQATLHVTGATVVPSSHYLVRHVAQSCAGAEATCIAVSTGLEFITGRWGDVTIPLQDASHTAQLSQPNISDVAAIIDRFKSAPTAMIVAKLDLHPAIPNGVVNIADVASCVDAFKNLAYPYDAEDACP